MKKVLPFVFPPIETYQGLSFMLGCVLANRNSKALYFNNYINIECARTDNIYNLQIYFCNAMWGDYWESGIAELNLFQVKNLTFFSFFRFVEERIDQNNYILLYEIDEYYLSHSLNYKKRHVRHDIYIYGYDDKYYDVVGYKEKKLQAFKIERNEIRKALFWAKIGQELNFCSFRFQPYIEVNPNLKCVRGELERYLNGSGYGKEDEDLMSFVVEVYDEIILCLHRIQKEKDIAIDIRPFRMLWEHKKVMKTRITELITMIGADINFVDYFSNLEKIAYKIFMNSLKYSVKQDISIIQGMIDGIIKMSCDEREYIEKILKMLESIEV